MPSAIVATSGSATANSFVTEVECDTYLDDRLNASSWNDLAAAADDKLRALIEATRWLTGMAWDGQRTDDVQNLSWPRDYAENPDLPESEDGLSTLTYFGNTVVPQRVKDATCELALQFLKSGTTDLMAMDTTSNIKKKKVSVLETEYVDPANRIYGLRKFPRIIQLIQPLLDPALSGGINLTRT